MKAIELFAANLGKRVESDKGIFAVALLEGKTGTLKNGEKNVPYVKLSNDDTMIELHPEKAKQLFSKGEFGALRIMADIAGEPVAPTMVAAAPVEDYSTSSETDDGAGTPPDAAPATKVGDAPAEPKKENKKAATLRIFNEMNKDGKQRKEIIARMRTELNMGVPGANTYYQNVLSGKWK